MTGLNHNGSETALHARSPQPSHMQCLGWRQHSYIEENWVGNRRDDPTLPWASPDDDRFAPQVRIVALLDRSVEGIHVDVQDGAGHGTTVTMDL